MPTTRGRRIVRLAVMALVVVVLLPVGYVGAYLGSQYLAGRGVVARATLKRLNDTIFAPLCFSDYHDRWGGRWLSDFGSRAYYTGLGDLMTERSDELLRQQADDVPPPLHPKFE